MVVTARLAHEPFEPDRELGRFLTSLADAGGVVSFVGIARGQSASGSRVTGLFLDHHPRLTLRSLEEIANAALTRFEISDALVVHRCGALVPGDPIVLAAAAARHRKPALEAVDYMMDRLKCEAVFWKREDGSATSTWIEPTGDDRIALARWSEKCPE